MTEGGGNGVVYLTQVMYVDDAQCQGGGLSNSQCPNWHKYVILKRVSIGNTSLRSSAYGTPNPALLNSDGSASAANYLRDNSLVVPTGAVLPGLAGGEFAYLSEAHFTMPNLSLPYFNVAGASYANSIY